MTKHTPPPWRVTMHGKAAYISMHIGKAGLPPSATGDAEFSVQPYGQPALAEANAAFIVQAVNAHDKLVAAVKILLVQLGDYQDGDGAAKFHAINIANRALDRAAGKAVQS